MSESWSEASSYSLAGRAGRLQATLREGLLAEEVGDTWGVGSSTFLHFLLSRLGFTRMRSNFFVALYIGYDFAINLFNVCFELDRVQAYLSMRGGFTSLALYGLGTEEGPQDFGPPGVNGVLGASGAPPGV